MLTNGAKRSRRCGGTDTRATRMPPCSDARGPAPAAGRVPSTAHRHLDTSRPPASHLKGGRRRRNLAAFLFKRKEKYPTTQRTKPITKRNSGSLCLLSVPRGASRTLLAMGTSIVHIRLVPARTRRQTRGTTSPPCALSPAGPAVAKGTTQACLWALSAPGSSWN